MTLSGEEIVELSRRHTLFDWSAQSRLAPMAVDHAEGVYFYTTDGMRYLDFNSQLMGVKPQDQPAALYHRGTAAGRVRDHRRGAGGCRRCYRIADSSAQRSAHSASSPITPARSSPLAVSP